MWSQCWNPALCVLGKDEKSKTESEKTAREQRKNKQGQRRHEACSSDVCQETYHSSPEISTPQIQLITNNYAENCQDSGTGCVTLQNCNLHAVLMQANKETDIKPSWPESFKHYVVLFIGTFYSFIYMILCFQVMFWFLTLCMLNYLLSLCIVPIL